MDGSRTGDSKAVLGELHMLVQVPLPDPREQVHWNKVALWPANNPYQNITYRAHFEAVHRIFKDDDVSCRNMTRAFRLLSASGMKPAGAEEWVSWAMACIAVPAKGLGVAATCVLPFEGICAGVTMRVTLELLPCICG